MLSLKCLICQCSVKQQKQTANNTLPIKKLIKLLRLTGKHRFWLLIEKRKEPLS